jgi:Trk K+ transport system NAD-binding subunit
MTPGEPSENVRTSAPPLAQAVLVCGLGSLGRQCVRALLRYRIAVRGVDVSQVDRGDLEEVPFVQGDCRYVEVLRRGGIDRCRAVLLVTGDPYANIEAALAARKLHPSIRIVARVAEQNLNALLASVVGNFVGFEPNRLAVGALALAALHSETVGYFHLDGQLLHVVRHEVTAGDSWLGMSVDELNAHGLLILEHHSPAGADDDGAVATREGPFHRYQPSAVVRAGDVLTVLSERGARLVTQVAPAAPAPATHDRRRIALADLVGRIRAMPRTRGVVVGAIVVIGLAIGVAMVLFPRADDSLSGADGFFTALVLMTGGTYADLFPAFHHLSNVVRLFSVLLSVIGTVAVGLLYAWLTERLMTLRLRLAPRRRRAPAQDHVIIVGLGRVGRGAADVLDELGRAVVGVEPTATIDQHALPRLSLVRGDGTDMASLEAARLGGARGLLAATDNDWMNLEVALLARKVNPDCAVVIRTKDTRFSDNVAGLVPGLAVMCIPVIAASAFAAAALGENVIDLFQLGPTTVFVVEYRIEAHEALRGASLAEIAEGYSVVPILHARAGHDARRCSISDGSIRLQLGDRLVLLGSATSLQRVERGSMFPRTARVTLSRLRPFADRLVISALLVQQLAYTLEHAQALLDSLPQTLPERLYPHHAERLCLALERGGATAELSPSSDEEPALTPAS